VNQKLEMAMTKFTMFRDEENTQEFAKGEVVFNEGDPGGEMYAVLDGRVELKLEGVKVNEVGADEIFGEMALIDGSNRSATALASTDCTLAIIDKPRFESFVRENPDFVTQVMAVMAERLRKTTIISIQEKIKRVDSSILDKLFLDDD